MHATYIALFRLAFASASLLNNLTSLHTFARRTVLQKVPDHTHEVLSVLVGTGFQVLFHSPPGVLFTFPSRYCSSIGHQVVFRVGGWSPQLPTGFHVSGGTLDPRWHTSVFAYGALTRYGRPSHTVLLVPVAKKLSTTPEDKSSGLPSSAFARHY